MRRLSQEGEQSWELGTGSVEEGVSGARLPWGAWGSAAYSGP